MWLKPISTSTNVEIQSIEDLKHQEILETTEGIIRISNAKIPIYQRKQ